MLEKSYTADETVGVALHHASLYMGFGAWEMWRGGV